MAQGTCYQNILDVMNLKEMRVVPDIWAVAILSVLNTMV